MTAEHQDLAKVKKKSDWMKKLKDGHNQGRLLGRSES